MLHIHENNRKIKNSTKILFDLLGLKTEPFKNVTYFLPRGRDGKPNSNHIPKDHKTFSYELKDIYDRLDLLFPEIFDPKYNLTSITDYIAESWPIQISSKENIKNWTDLSEFKGYPEYIVSHKSSLLRFLGHLQRFRKSSLFIDKKITSTYLGKEIRNISAGQVFLVDIAKISSLCEQEFEVGDVMKAIDEIYSSGFTEFYDQYPEEDIKSNQSKKKIKQIKETPKYVLIFIDEINRFMPKSFTDRINAVQEQIMKTLIAGKSRGTILFSAQQFKSQTDYRLQENIGLHVVAKLGDPELCKDPYSMIDKSTKANISRLNKGEFVMIHPSFRHPIKVSFPPQILKKPFYF